MEKLVPLTLPPAPLKLGKRNGQIWVWDELRKKNLVLTPEEWVRQHLVHYLRNELGYPSTAFALEGGFKLYGRSQRTDLLIYHKGQALMIGECKAPQVKITQETFDQACRYNLHYQVPYLLISNGLETYWAKVNTEENRLSFIQDALSFKALIAGL
tara:strand:+ start:1602 stop:2069 length:468 start_codon:yes stop_codon:yes gene_type:complete